LLSNISGIDEAGRGSVFGSLIIVGVTLDQKSMKNLVKNGLKDSKLFSGPQGQKKRTELALKIQELALELRIVEIPANEIDHTLNNRPTDNLNYLEIRNIGQIVHELSSEEITIDSISNPKYFKKHLIVYLNRVEESLSIMKESHKPGTSSFSIKRASNDIKRVVISEKADRIFPVVSAASCVAKYVRDKHLREIEREWNLNPFCLGQGYPNEKDSKVMKFLQKYHNEIQNRSFPFIRYSWSWTPLQKIIRAPLKTLEEFLDEQKNEG
jgi:ribonuclease HII